MQDGELRIMRGLTVNYLKQDNRIPSFDDRRGYEQSTGPSLMEKKSRTRTDSSNAEGAESGRNDMGSNCHIWKER